MICCKIVSTIANGFEIHSDITQKTDNEQRVILDIDSEYFEKLNTVPNYKQQKELEFLFNLHSGNV